MKILILLLATLVASMPVDAAKKTRKAKQGQVQSFSAKSYVIANTDGVIISEQNGSDIRPIASITKIMVGVLAAEQDLNERLEIPAKRSVQSSIPYSVKTLSRQELLTLALVKSDNFAAQILCDNIENCIDRMNDKAKFLQMENTKFVEPTGLSKDNVSTAEDLLRLMLEASKIDIVAETSSKPKAEIDSSPRIIRINNTNPLTSKLNITLSKTGFTNPAGGCLVMIMDSPVGRRILILLGSRNAKTRIPDMERLVKNL